jgi:hypothetical protein
MKNYDSLTESRMLWALLAVAAAVFEYYCIVELLFERSAAPASQPPVTAVVSSK